MVGEIDVVVRGVGVQYSGTPHMSFNHQGRFVQTTKPCLSTLSLKLNTRTGGHAIPPDLHRTRNANSSLKDGSCKYHSFLQVTKDIFIHRLIMSLTRRRSGHRVRWKSWVHIAMMSYSSYRSIMNSETTTCHDIMRGALDYTPGGIHACTPWPTVRQVRQMHEMPRMNKW
jgi:hypothetical protein